jgi:hypothetical protein
MLDPTTVQKIHSVQFVTECHDQGYCDTPDNGNWTWFELCIMENDEATKPRWKDGVELTWISHTNRFTERDYGYVCSESSPSVVSCLCTT